MVIYSAATDSYLLIVGEWMSSAAAGYFGIKPSVIVAGFLGGVIAMTFVRALTRTQMVVAVMTGTVTTHYLTPMAVYYTGLNTEREDGIAFLIGIMAMNIIPGMLKLSEIFSNDPRSLIPSLKGKADDADNR
jgi:hypothetical protein